MINKYIQKLREQNNFSQKYMASKLGISRPTYIDIEKGKRDITLKEAGKIADILNISIDQLIHEKKQITEVNIVRDKSVSRKNEELRINIPQKNYDKFREVLLYILSKVGAQPNIGETVLYKLLYFIDFDYYEKYEEQIIGATYIKNHYGPTPVEFKKLILEMEKRGEVELIKSKYFQHEQKKYLAVRSADFSELLSAQELAHIDNVLDRLSNMNAHELTEYSHQDVPWITAEEGKPIEYESVFYRTSKTSVRNYEED